MAKATLEPMGDRIIAKRDAVKEKTDGGIFIPEGKQQQDKKEIQIATVIAVGPGRRTDDGSYLPMPFKAGDRIYFDKYGANEVKIDGEELIALEERAIICRVA